MSWRLDRAVEFLVRSPGVDDFVAIERAGTRVSAGPGGLRARHRDIHVDVALFRDVGSGRGATHVRITADGRDIGARLTAAIQRAAQAMGPVWGAPPPAAPARVEVADPAIGDDLDAALERLLARSRRLRRDLVQWQLAVERWDSQVQTSAGLDSRFASTLVGAEAVPAAAPGAPVGTCARRLIDLDWTADITAAAARRRDRDRATAVAPDRCDLVLSGAALVSDITAPAAPERGLPAVDLGAFGWFAPLLAQADAHRVRLGLTRYRPGQPIHEGPAPVGERLTLSSDGTIPYGLRSRPFGDLGAPMRQHTLVADGVAVDLLRDPREAALDHGLLTGGIGNLVMPPGRTPPDALRASTGRPVLELASLAWLDIDPDTGELAAGIDLGYLDGAPITGPTIRGNLFTWLARMSCSAQLAQRGWYRGPEAVRFDDVELA
ncbi:metallopeptidase TldD-related protein [Haliangium sp.]|uniref:metallopeptidase TldD-related protein n=1 Tax=Haliangium sp. TaxID=2663208 RepID=UPI003D14EB7A